MKVAILGGTGKFGSALAKRVAQTEHEVAIASRDASKAEAAARSIGHATGMTHAQAAAWCDIAVVAVPYSSHAGLLDLIKRELQGKIVIDAAIPLDPGDPTRIRTTSGTSAAEEAAAILDDAHVFGAFHTISHRVLENVTAHAQVLLAGSGERKAEVFEFLRGLRLTPVHAGGLKASGLLECMTALLISVNKQNKVKESGIHITGIPGA